MKTLAFTACAFALGMVASSAGADATGRLEALPAGRLPAVPSTSPQAHIPAQIPATEKVDGIFLAIAPEAMRLNNEYNGNRPVLVTTDEQRAIDFAKSGRSTSKRTGPTTCFAGSGDAVTQSLRITPRPRPVPTPPPTPGRPVVLPRQVAPPPRPAVMGGRLLPPPPPPQKFPTVRAMRTERFVAGDGDRASLEVVDAWVDLETLGARVARKTSVPLQRVARGPQGMDIFASRDGADVTFVVRTPRAPAEAGEQSLSAQLSDGSSASSTSCGTLGFTLTSEAGSGQMANVLAMMVLSGRSAEDTEPDPEPQEGEPKHGAFHMRPLVANVSVSQTKSEASPVLSVTFGWTGKDQQVTF